MDVLLPATAAAAAATATATTAAAAATATAATTAATATTATTVLAFLCFVDADVTPVEAGAIQFLDSGLCLFVGVHLNEGEAAWAACITVGDDMAIGDISAARRKGSSEGVLGGIPGQVADVESLGHCSIRSFAVRCRKESI
jgi:hypothetical protein